jgi:hypothetical protein
MADCFGMIPEAIQNAPLNCKQVSTMSAKRLWIQNEGVKQMKCA